MVSPLDAANYKNLP